MQNENKGVLILILVIVVVLEAVFLNLSLQEKNKISLQGMQISAQRQRLSNELNAAQRAVESLRGSLEAKKVELIDEQSRVRAMETEIVATKKSMDSLAKELNLIRNISQEKEDGLQRTLKKLEDLRKAKLEPVKRRLKESSRIIDRDRKKISELEDKIQKSEKICLLLAETNKSLTEKSKELELANSNLSQEQEILKSELAKRSEELAVQEKNISEINSANQKFKEQMSQVSVIMTAKELELADQKKAAEDLNAKVSGLETEKSGLETAFKTMQSEQENAKTLIAEVEQLNQALNEKIANFSQPMKEKEKAEELKRKVEVILNPASPR